MAIDTTRDTLYTFCAVIGSREMEGRIVEPVPFRLVGGYPLCEGMLCWVKRLTPQKGSVMAKILAITPNEDLPSKDMTFRVGYADGTSEEVNGARVTPLFTAPPGEGEIPAVFQSLVSYEVAGVTFALGNDIYFPNEVEFRETTGHAKALCISTLMMLGDGGILYAGGHAIDAQDKAHAYLFEAKLEEVEVVCRRIPIGTRLHTRSVRGTCVRDIFTPDWVADGGQPPQP